MVSQNTVQIERKRFIGNDQVVLVYREDTSSIPSTSLDFDSFSSKQIHVVIVIDRVEGDSLQFSISIFQRKCMPGIPKFHGEPTIYSMEKSIHRDYILTKSTLMLRVLALNLTNLYSSHIVGATKLSK